MLTVSEDEQDLAAALRGGASGYLLKTIEGDALVARHRPRDARRVGRGRGNDRQAGRGVPRRGVCARAGGPGARGTGVAARAACRRASRKSCARIARGASNKEIGRELGIAETTVKIHVQHVLRKLDVSSRVQAAVIASEHGLV